MAATTERAELGNPAYQAFLLLRVGFTAAPILFGLDKFFNWTVEWTNYLAPWVDDIAPGSGQDFMYVVGVVEIAAGLLVAVAPRIGAYVVAAWLAGIILNLLTVDPPVLRHRPARFRPHARRADARPAEHRVPDGAGGFAGRGALDPAA